MEQRVLHVFERTPVDLRIRTDQDQASLLAQAARQVAHRALEGAAEMPERQHAEAHDVGLQIVGEHAQVGGGSGQAGVHGIEPRRQRGQVGFIALQETNQRAQIAERTFIVQLTQLGPQPAPFTLPGFGFDAQRRQLGQPVEEL